MGSTRFDLDHFDRLPDSLIISIFNKIGDVKSLGCCCTVNRRFNSLVPQVDQILVRVDCVISDDEESATSSPSPSTVVTSRHPISSLFRIFFNGLFKPVQSITQFIIPSQNSENPIGESSDPNDAVTHHSPTQVLKNFREIRALRIELPTGELGIEDGVLLKWKANFGSTLENCVILGASSVATTSNHYNISNTSNNEVENDDNGNIPESFYTNGGLKLRVVWTISSLIAASARHYLLQPIIAEHETLEKLILTDVDGQGMLCMNKEQLSELRVKPLLASSSSKRTLVPALNMRLWYAPTLELPHGTVLNGATLVAIRPSEKKEAAEDGERWVAEALEEPFASAARMLLKRKTYCLEMNSF